MRRRILSLLFLVSLAVAGGWLVREFIEERSFDLTGESEFLPQVRGVFQYLSNRTRPAPRTEDYAAIAHAGVNPFGVNTFLQLEVEPAKRERQMEMIREAGFRWIRQEFPWEDIEISAKGDFWDHKWDKDAWEKYDNIVDLANEHDLKIIARLSNPPAWTRALTDTIGPLAPPDNVADFGDFVESVVSRYKGRIQHYQLWNEPNIYPEWGEQAVDPVGYTDLLCEGYQRAKAVDPAVVILSGALAPTIELSGRDLNDFIFLQRMYDAGAAECFDVMSVQGYSLWSAPTDHRMRPLVVNYGRVAYIRDVMVRNGDTHKPIWISEMNSNAVPVGAAAQGIIGWGSYGQVSLQEQAEWAVLAYKRAQEEWPFVGVVNFWFFKPASDSDANQAYYYFRMLEPEFTPLPVYRAMQAYANQRPRMYPGTHQEDHWAARWEGEWFVRSDAAAMLGSYRLAGQNATVHVCVEGGALEIQQVPGPDQQGGLSVERDNDGCLTIHAEPGAAIDGFAVRRKTNRLGAWALVTLSSLLVIGWGLKRRRQRAP